ncbi:MAG: hypothetical protein H7832_15110 [Magnetococcus sp. DMHC-6]
MSTSRGTFAFSGLSGIIGRGPGIWLGGWNWLGGFFVWTERLGGWS